MRKTAVSVVNKVCDCMLRMLLLDICVIASLGEMPTAPVPSWYVFHTPLGVVSPRRQVLLRQADWGMYFRVAASRAWRPSAAATRLRCPGLRAI